MHNLYFMFVIVLHRCVHEVPAFGEELLVHFEGWHIGRGLHAGLEYTTLRTSSTS